MQNELGTDSNRDSAATQFVSWSYTEHPSRWVVAAIAFSQAAVLSAGLFSGHTQAINPTQSVGGYFVFTWIGVAIMLSFVVICLRPRVNGCFIRSNDRFELDSGRRAPDFLCALTFWSRWATKPRSLFTADLAALRGEYSGRFFPRRHKIMGQINEIEGVTLLTAVLGPKIILRLRNGDALTVVEDVSAEEFAKVYEKIQGLVSPNLQ